MVTTWELTCHVTLDFVPSRNNFLLTEKIVTSRKFCVECAIGVVILQVTTCTVTYKYSTVLYSSNWTPVPRIFNKAKVRLNISSMILTLSHAPISAIIAVQNSNNCADLGVGQNPAINVVSNSLCSVVLLYTLDRCSRVSSEIPELVEHWPKTGLEKFNQTHHDSSTHS